MDPDLSKVLAFLSGLIGAIIGSFLNVVIYRLPEGRSVVKPPSMCQNCGTPIKFYDNIPIVSFFLLQGGCRSCGQKISWRYPAIESLSAAMSITLYLKWGLNWAFPVFLVFCLAMLVVFWIDLDHMIIPDVITLPGCALGVTVGIFNLTPDLNWQVSLEGLLLGAVVPLRCRRLFTKKSGVLKGLAVETSSFWP